MRINIKLKGLIVISLLVIVFAVYFKKKPPYQVANLPSISKKNELEPHVIPIKSNIPSKDLIKNEMDSHNTEVVSSYDQHGSKTEIHSLKPEAVMEQVNSKDSILLEDEFKSLAPINFHNAESATFSGKFIDEQNDIKLSIVYSGDTGELGNISCIKVKNNLTIFSPDGDIQIRDDGFGYAIILIKEKWYFRLGYSFSPGRSLVGKFYQKVESDWRLVGRTILKEDKATKTVLDKCPY